MKTNPRLVIRTVAGLPARFFEYSPAPDVRFSCSLYCEISERFKPLFASRIKGLVEVEITQRPWIITIPRSIAIKQHLSFTEIVP